MLFGDLGAAKDAGLANLSVDIGAGVAGIERVLSKLASLNAFGILGSPGSRIGFLAILLSL
jgi:hypothetical protein